MEQIRRVMRPTDVPDQGLLCDLLWADPDKDVLGWGENDRGVSFTFGADVVAKFLHKHDMDLICRAHQVCDQYSSGRERESTVQCVFLYFLPCYSVFILVCGSYEMPRSTPRRWWRTDTSSSLRGSWSLCSLLQTTVESLTMPEP